VPASGTKSSKANFTSPSAALGSLKARSIHAPTVTHFGISASDAPSVVARLRQKQPGEVVEASVVVPPRLTAAPPNSTRLLPTEVSLETAANGSTTLVEYYPDLGACKTHWVGVARRIPLDSAGNLDYARESYQRANSTARYEQGLEAFAQKQYPTAFQLLAPTVTWSVEMRQATIIRLIQAHLDNKFISTLDPLRLKKGAAVTLREEPHPSANAIKTLFASSNPAMRRVATVSAAKDAKQFRRIATTGQWDLVLVLDEDVNKWELGFVLRSPGAFGSRVHGEDPDTRLAARRAPTSSSSEADVVN